MPLKLKRFSDREKVPQHVAEKVDKDGVVVEYEGKWRIVSKKQKPYEFWDAKYNTKKDAEDALAAYHANKGFSNRSSKEDSEHKWGWVLVEDSGKNVWIHYNEGHATKLPTKSAASDHLENYIRRTIGPDEKVLYKKVLIFEKEGDEMLDKLREKYPKAGVAGVY